MADYSPVLADDTFTATAGAAITGGQLLAWTGADTVSPTTGPTQAFAGVAGHDAPSGGLVTVFCGDAVHETLSDREFEVLRALGSGMMVKEVAEQLRLSAKTVSTYRTRLLEKMGLKTKADIVRYVVTHNLLK